MGGRGWLSLSAGLVEEVEPARGVAYLCVKLAAEKLSTREGFVTGSPTSASGLTLGLCCSPGTGSKDCRKRSVHIQHAD